MSKRIEEYRPPRIAMALLVLAAALHLAVAYGFFAVFRSVPAGVSVAAGGVALMLGAWWQFRVREVDICPTAATARLITTGTYRFTRNPMYLGIVLMLTGIALTVGSLPFFAAAALFAAIIDRHFVSYEEAKLRAAFGDEYANYAARVRRWI